VDLDTLQFIEPHWLWLLIVPLALLIQWLRKVIARRRDAKQLAKVRELPIKERHPFFGDSLFWLFITVATSLLIAALARPVIVASLVNQGGIDLVVLLDGSASMHVKDVPGDRWKRSTRFLRTLGDALRWDNDRIALTLFARIAAPQIRLTKDPNTFFFFLDHLSEKSPFPLENDTSWDTNIELGLYWGMRVIEKDEELLGPSKNAPLFLLISDGQAWSGTVDESIQLAKSRGIPVVVVGVGTFSGGFIPESSNAEESTASSIYSVLDRKSLHRIAEASNGQYYELGRDSDLNLANQIIDSARQRVKTSPPEPKLEELYRSLLLISACLCAMGVLFLNDRNELLIQAIGSGLMLTVLYVLFG
tara:strand:- start:95 stop:1180 length:1086 start_codon:yes stop_codon:yes gene_type:complete